MPPGHSGVHFQKKGGPARNRVVFINSERRHKNKGGLSENANVADLAFFFLSHRSRQYRGKETPSKDFPLMKTA